MSERRTMFGLTGALLIVGAMVLAGCGSSSSSGTTTPTTAGNSGTASHPSTTVWLCRPGTNPDPCTSSLGHTTVPAAGARTVTSSVPDPNSAFDCFYVYPTVSPQRADNANLDVQAAEIGAAVAQASPFSPVCRVWAPIYRQRTLRSLASGLGVDPTADDVAYQSVLAGWTDYLDHDNDGRPVIFIGHSQGAAMLIRLLSSQIDDNPTLRGRMVSAVIAGGNVQVPTGQAVGATFKHIPLCTATGQTGCTIAYSTFPTQPPLNSLFGRPGQGVSLQSGQTATAGQQVACVNPAALGGGAAGLTPWFLTRTMPPPRPAVLTPWVLYPELYDASCQTSGGATWLQVTDVAEPGDTRPVVSETLGPKWGYHLYDVNLPMGNLLQDLRLQESAYTSAHG